MRSTPFAPVVLLCATALAWPFTSCRSSSDPAEGAGGVGTLRMDLTTQTSGTTYRLQNATFSITGTTSMTLSETDPDEPVLSATLPVGSYEILLQDGWSLARLDGTTWDVVQATLVSPNPTSFTIVAGGTTSVVFQFETNGTIVSVGTGTLDVTIDVQELPGVCDTTCQEVCVPQFTAALAAALPSAVCVPPETLTSPSGDAQVCSSSTCTDGTTGCEVSIQWMLVYSGGLYVATAVISEPVDVSATVFGIPISCTATVDATVDVTVQPAFYTLGGKLLASAQSVQTTVMSFSVSGCDGLGSLIDALAPLLEDQVTTAVSDQVTVYIEQVSVPCLQ
jgi:hypothetical protein